MSSPKAREEGSVRSLYQNGEVARTYIEERFRFSWSRLLHERQVGLLNALIAEERIETALELAPGPARVTTGLTGIRSGLMVEGSPPMIEIARERLAQAGLGNVWQIRHGNAFDLSDVSETFDLVFSFRFIRHFERADRARLYREIAGRLRPQGLLVFDVVNRPLRERLDARAGKNAPGLQVHDALFTEEELRAEMSSAGFEVVALHPLLRHFPLQSWLSYKLDDRVPTLVKRVVDLLERLPSHTPLEWLAVCRKRATQTAR